MSGILGWRVAGVRALVGMGLMAMWGGSSQGAERTGQGLLVLYVETPDRVEAPLRLEIEGARLVGDAESIELDLSTTILDADETRGRQIRWSEQWVPAGHYDWLAITVGRVEGTVGRARVQPVPPADALKIPLDLYLESAEATLAVLRWDPHPIDPDLERYVPSVTAISSPVPPAGSMAFVSNEGSGYVSVIDRFTGKLVDVVAVGEGPRGLAYSELHQWLYVACSGSNEIVAFDVLAMRVAKRMVLGFGDEPSRLAHDGFRDVLYVLNYQSETLTVVDPRTLQELGRVLIGRGPRGITLDRATGRVYVSLALDGHIQVYDPVQGALLKPVSPGPTPGEILFGLNAGALYVTSEADRRMRVFLPETGAVSPGITLCSAVGGLAYNPVSRQLYVSQTDCRTIAILQPENELDIGSIRLPERPGLISLDAGLRILVVTLPESDQVAVYNVNSRKLSGLVEVGDRPYAVMVP